MGSARQSYSRGLSNVRHPSPTRLAQTEGMSAVHPPLLPLLSEGRARADDAKKEPPDEEPEKEEEGEPLSD
jgi:hypothetical protein